MWTSPFISPPRRLIKKENMQFLDRLGFAETAHHYDRTREQ